MKEQTKKTGLYVGIAAICIFILLIIAVFVFGSIGSPADLDIPGNYDKINISHGSRSYDLDEHEAQTLAEYLNTLQIASRSYSQAGSATSFPDGNFSVTFYRGEACVQQIFIYDMNKIFASQPELICYETEESVIPFLEEFYEKLN